MAQSRRNPVTRLLTRIYGNTRQRPAQLRFVSTDRQLDRASETRNPREARWLAWVQTYSLQSRGATSVLVGEGRRPLIVALAVLDIHDHRIAFANRLARVGDRDHSVSAFSRNDPTLSNDSSLFVENPNLIADDSIFDPNHATITICGALVNRRCRGRPSRKHRCGHDQGRNPGLDPASGTIFIELLAQHRISSFSNSMEQQQQQQPNQTPKTAGHQPTLVCPSRPLEQQSFRGQFQWFRRITRRAAVVSGPACQNSGQGRFSYNHLHSAVLPKIIVILSAYGATMRIKPCPIGATHHGTARQEDLEQINGAPRPAR